MRRDDQRGRQGDELRYHEGDWQVASPHDPCFAAGTQVTLPHDPHFAAGTQEIEKVPPTDAYDTELVDIVHDLKNPLATIALEMCLLAEKLGVSAPPDMHGSVHRIRLNISYLDRMVQDILDSAAIDDMRLALNRHPTELTELIAQTIERSVASRDLPRITVVARTPIMLDIDALRIERVLANLIHNALKYAPAPTPVTVSLDAGTNKVVISVSDRGPGLTKDEQRIVFDKYGRVPGPSSREGTGLGLYVARRIIDAHGGTIDVFSVPNVGSRFFFELPVS
jgi:signal transduction histidine kinase